MRRISPRTFFGQLVLTTIVVQVLLLVLFTTYTIVSQTRTLEERGQQRAAKQLERYAKTASDLLARGEMASLQDLLELARNGQVVEIVRLTRMDGSTIAVTDSAKGRELRPDERALLPELQKQRIYKLAGGQWEAVTPVLVDGKQVALLWLEPSTAPVPSTTNVIVRICLTYGLLALLANLLPIFLITRTMTRPLGRLRDATLQMMQAPVTAVGFPLPVTTRNEAGELTISFNAMVNELEQQRSDLLETLALLDSTMENAPIGFAFFDKDLRYVRVNTVLANAHGLAAGDHEGRSIDDFYSAQSAQLKASCIIRVFETGEAVRDLQLSGEMSNAPGIERSWQMHFYPIWSKQKEIKWVGVIVVEITERLRSEEALRKTEKLAATGRLAASIAHEINNPLEAVTNLLYLLSIKTSLDPEAVEYVAVAQSELARVSEITQQTLRFYRQSTSPAETDIADVLKSIVTLYQPRLTTAGVLVVKRFRGESQVFGFSGELRQVFANLIGNAIDAMPQGGRLLLDARPGMGRLPDGTWVDGVRVVVADTGSGMSETTLQRMFEAFYTTKQATGTGLGLWVCEEIIRKHGGIVRVRTRQGEPSGTVFMLFFPNGRESEELTKAS